MIDPTKLTAENGFVDGVVVEIVWEGCAKSWEQFRGSEYWAEGDCEMARTIRPLTGPMAIWNFAPEWATHCWLWESGDVSWFANDPTMSHGYSSGNGYGETLERPFWARSDK